MADGAEQGAVRRSARVAAGPAVTLAREDASKGTDAALDPWAPLDPHETEGMGEVHAPFKKLTTYKVRQLLPRQTCCPVHAGGAVESAQSF